MAGQTIVVSVLADTAKFKQGMNSLGSMTKGLMVGGAALAAGVGIWAAGTIKDMMRTETLSANTAAVIKATGGAAGRSATQVSAFADKFEKLTGMEAETVTEGQNVLLTFKNIKGTNFDKATKSAADLAVWLNKGSLEGANMAGASNMMGKALDNPTKGMTALSKVGVSFTDQEKEQIKTMQAKGNMAGAQAIILKAVNGQVAGSSVAAGKTTAGMWAKIQNAIGNVSEDVLSFVLPALLSLGDWFMKEGLPAIKGFGDWIKANLVPAMQGFGSYITSTVVPALAGFGKWIQDNAAWLIPLGIVIGTIAAGFAIWTGAMAAWTAITTAATAIQAAFNVVLAMNPIGLIIIAIIALVAGLVYFFTQTEVGKAAWAAFSDAMGKTWEAIKGAFQTGMNAVMGFLGKVWDYIKLVWNYSPYGLIINNWSKIMDFFGKIPGWVKGVFDSAVSWLKSAGENILKGMQAGVDIAWKTVTTWFNSIDTKVKGFFDGAASWLKSAGDNIVEGLWKGISNGYNWITGKIRSWVGNVLDFVKKLFGIASPSKVFAGYGKFMVQGLAKGITDSTKYATNALDRLSNDMSVGFNPELGINGANGGDNVYYFGDVKVTPANSNEEQALTDFIAMIPRLQKAGV